MEALDRAYELLENWRGDNYVFGVDVIGCLGKLVKRFGTRALLISTDTYAELVEKEVMSSLREEGITVVRDTFVPGAKPNAPREDVYRLESYLLHDKPDCVVAVGGGSTIDACKAAIMLEAYGAGYTPEIDAYFGTGLVTEAEQKTGKKMLPFIAVQTSASSGAHLTKYANITDPVVGQKKLIVDPAIVPSAALFDYKTTISMPAKVSIDGALDAVAHTLEVFAGRNRNIMSWRES